MTLITAIELQHVGNSLLLVLSYVGTLVARKSCARRER